MQSHRRRVRLYARAIPLGSAVARGGGMLEFALRRGGGRGTKSSVWGVRTDKSEKEHPEP